MGYKSIHLLKALFKINSPGGEGETLECNMTGSCLSFKNLHNLFRKNIYISIPCFGIFRLQNNTDNSSENNSLLFFNK